MRKGWRGEDEGRNGLNSRASPECLNPDEDLGLDTPADYSNNIDLFCRYVDYLLVMAYNYHGSWNQFTGHHSGLFPRSDEVGGEREWNQVGHYCLHWSIGWYAIPVPSRFASNTNKKRSYRSVTDTRSHSGKRDFKADVLWPAVLPDATPNNITLNAQGLIRKLKAVIHNLMLNIELGVDDRLLGEQGGRAEGQDYHRPEHVRNDVHTGESGSTRTQGGHHGARRGRQIHEGGRHAGLLRGHYYSIIVQ